MSQVSRNGTDDKLLGGAEIMLKFVNYFIIILFKLFIIMNFLN